MIYHDHGLVVTRLNVYAGLVGLYLIRDGVEDALRLPSGRFEVPLLLQDKSFNADGSLFYPTGPANPPVTTPPFPFPSVVPEFFGDVAVVNGRVWPFLSVEPRLYRFRIVAGGNARFFNVALFEWCKARGVDLSKPGPQFLQIGSDQGFMPQAVPITGRILLGPAERVDVLIDFRGFAGRDLLLHNNAPTPFQGTFEPTPDDVPLPELLLIKVKHECEDEDEEKECKTKPKVEHHCKDDEKECKTKGDGKGCNKKHEEDECDSHDVPESETCSGRRSGDEEEESSSKHGRKPKRVYAVKERNDDCKDKDGKDKECKSKSKAEPHKENDHKPKDDEKKCNKDDKECKNKDKDEPHKKDDHDHKCKPDDKECKSKKDEHKEHDGKPKDECKNDDKECKHKEQDEQHCKPEDKDCKHKDERKECKDGDKKCKEEHKPAHREDKDKCKVEPPRLRFLPPFIPLAPTVTRSLRLSEGEDEFGRNLLQLEGVPFEAPVTTLVALGASETWAFVNPTTDVHPMHIHLVRFHVASRRPFNVTIFEAALTTLQNDPTNPVALATIDAASNLFPYTGLAAPEEPTESGWKDTVKVRQTHTAGRVASLRALALTLLPTRAASDLLFSFVCSCVALLTCLFVCCQATPGFVTSVVALFDRAGPYVFHCHILEHEDHDMMRPYIIFTN